MADRKTGKDIHKIVEQTLLYDFYGELLTEHQKNIYEDVVLNDMSLSEIAENYEISRQAVSDLMKRIEKLLFGYESKLHLVEKFENAKDKVREIRVEAEVIQDAVGENKDTDRTVLKDRVKRIAEISDSILEDF